MNRPLFSVIVPAHNSEAYIKKGLHSIRQQSFRDFELIVVCDRCTDDTPGIALGYADKTLIRDFGHDGLARNAGIDAAEGEWLLFMDDDDWWLHEYVLQMLSEKIDQNPAADIIAFSFIFRHIGYATPIRNINGQHWPACWCKCYRREAVNGSRFSDITDGSADMQFFTQMFFRGLKVVDWDMPLYYYNYWRDDSISERQTYDFRGRTDLL